ncbi:MAG: carboxypeptidase regulatory-like domain-containing protein [Bryobacteraceae bacterium]
MLAFALVAWMNLATLSGMVEDPSGAPVPGVRVILQPARRRAVTGLEGEFRFENLAPGRYRIEARHPDFRPARMSVDLAPGAQRAVRIVLHLAELRQELTVSAQAEPLSVNPTENPEAVRWQRGLLRALPVFDLDLLGTAAILLDPAQAGSGGYQVVVDGMETDRLGVTVSAIREVRINQNPYSAEFSAPGRGRLEVITARAESRYHGELNLLLRDHRLDARNAFAPGRPRQQRRTVEGHFTGPLARSRRWSFLASGSREADDQESVVYALTPTGLWRQQAPRLERDAETSLRLDFQPDERRSLSWRYEMERDSTRGDGVGGFELPEVATDSSDREQALYFSLQQIHDPHWLHQLQARLRGEREQLRSRNPGVLRIVAEDAFTGGGGQREESLLRTRGEVYELWSRSAPRHWFKLGWSLREAGRARYRDGSNREGTFRFATLEDYLTGRPYAFTRQVGEGEIRYGNYRVA